VPGGALLRTEHPRLVCMRLTAGWWRLGEVEMCSRARAAADEVVPLLQRALPVDQDEGALDRRTLGGVAGERVSVLQVIGRMANVDRASRRYRSAV
jgi:hypothetical protein